MKQPGRKNLVIWIVVLMMAGACAAPSAPAPTPAPPTLAPTPAAPTPATAPPTAAPTTAAPTPVPPTAVPATLAPTPNVLVLITAFQDAYNKGDTNSLMPLFVEDPNWTLGVGMYGTGETLRPANTTKDVRDTLEIGFKINSRLEASDCTTKNGGASCTLVIKDDCQPPTVDAYRVRAQVTFTDGKIASVYGRWESSDESIFTVYDAARLGWARLNLPADVDAYSVYFGYHGTGGLPPGETASEFGQAVERMCKGYKAAGN